MNIFIFIDENAYVNVTRKPETIKRLIYFMINKTSKKQ